MSPVFHLTVRERDHKVMIDREFPGDSGEDLANCASHKDFLLARQKRHICRTRRIVKAATHRLIEDKVTDRLQVS